MGRHAAPAQLLGVESKAPSFLYFFGVALVLFSMRRIGDQRSERAKRLAAERDVADAGDARSADAIAQPAAIPERAQRRAEEIRQQDERAAAGIWQQFKKLNEVYGHVGCDEALVQIGARIRERATPATFSRASATTNSRSASPAATPNTRAGSPARWSRRVKKPVQIGIEQTSIGASVGIAQAGRGHVTVDELLRCAHVALSRARTIHTEYCFFDPKMDAHIRERSLLEKDLRAAIGGDAIQPYYQPIVDLKTRRIVSFESLARWHNPVSGLILPDTFIPLAEELGLLDAVSGQLFGDACRDAVNWPEDVSLTFNFSPSQLADRSFADAVLAVLADTGFPPHRLEAEITESALVEDLEATRHAIQTLRNAGVRIVIDDFGTGYSSLYHLYELRFDKLKIDRALHPGTGHHRRKRGVHPRHGRPVPRAQLVGHRRRRRNRGAGGSGA